MTLHLAPGPDEDTITLPESASEQAHLILAMIRALSAAHDFMLTSGRTHNKAFPLVADVLQRLTDLMTKAKGQDHE
jgi:hypothetical protein